MIEALTGFAVVGVAIVLGWIIGRTDLLGEHARPVLARLTFFVLVTLPALRRAGRRPMCACSSPRCCRCRRSPRSSVIADLRAVARFVWKRPLGEIVIGALSAGQVNSNNIGIPLSLYLLGIAPRTRRR